MLIFAISQFWDPDCLLPGDDMLYNLGVMTDPVSAPDYDEAARTIVGQHKGEKVIIITDGDHFRTQDVHDLAFATAKAGREQGITDVGLEFLPRSQQKIIDSLASGQISKEEFLGIFDGAVTTHMDAAQTKVFYARLADEIQDGTKIHAQGTMVGISGITRDQAAIIDQTQILAFDKELDFIKFQREHAAELADDPKALAQKMYEQAEARRSTMSPEQLAGLAEIKAGMDTPGRSAAAYQSSVKSLFEINHPSFQKMSELSQKIGSMSGHSDINVRQKQDAEIADYIKQDMPENGSLLVVYGRGHTIHKQDIDANLRKQGISVMIVDAEIGGRNLTCTPIESPEVCDGRPRIMNNIDRARDDDRDPNRYRMPDFQKEPGTIKPVDYEKVKALLESPDAIRMSSVEPERAVPVPPGPQVKTPDFVA